MDKSTLPKQMLTLLFMLYAAMSMKIVYAEIYKWVDDKGNVHYGDKPTPDGQQIDVTKAAAKTGNLPKQSREDRRQKLLQAMDEDRLEKKNKEAKLNKQKSRQKARCANAKDRLRRYERAGSLYDLDKEGNRVFLSKDERQQATKKLSTSIKKYCN
ncbi:MAG: DUF4124 domain-containing protein [Gammaproteobacteria bacterium]|nr:DUF4124 domain-containing protein [Gammaproteobacteria bacterium]